MCGIAHGAPAQAGDCSRRPRGRRMLKVNAHNNSAREQLVQRVEETEQVGCPWVMGDQCGAPCPAASGTMQLRRTDHPPMCCFTSSTGGRDSADYESCKMHHGAASISSPDI